MLFLKLSIHQRILKMYYSFHKNIKQHNCIDKKKHMRMISEESRDTENWSNDAENPSLHHRNKLHLNRKQLF